MEGERKKRYGRKQESKTMEGEVGGGRKKEDGEIN